jgi:hypothetical protein
MDRRYEIRILGYLGPVLTADVGMRCESVSRQTTLRGQLSHGELRRLLRRLDEHGVSLIRLDHAEPRPVPPLTAGVASE